MSERARSIDGFLAEVEETLGPEVADAIERILDQTGLTVVRRPATRTPFRRTDG